VDQCRPASSAVPQRNSAGGMQCSAVQRSSRRRAVLGGGRAGSVIGKGQGLCAESMEASCREARPAEERASVPGLSDLALFPMRPQLAPGQSTCTPKIASCGSRPVPEVVSPANAARICGGSDSTGERRTRRDEIDTDRQTTTVVAGWRINGRTQYPRRWWMCRSGMDEGSATTRGEPKRCARSPLNSALTLTDLSQLHDKMCSAVQCCAVRCGRGERVRRLAPLGICTSGNAQSCHEKAGDCLFVVNATGTSRLPCTAEQQGS
jgi:hypothetical protein